MGLSILNNYLELQKNRLAASTLGGFRPRYSGDPGQTLFKSVLLKRGPQDHIPQAGVMVKIGPGDGSLGSFLIIEATEGKAGEGNGPGGSFANSK
jgi:hypothetical protein